MPGPLAPAMKEKKRKEEKTKKKRKGLPNRRELFLGKESGLMYA